MTINITLNKDFLLNPIFPVLLSVIYIPERKVWLKNLNKPSKKEKKNPLSKLDIWNTM